MKTSSAKAKGRRCAKEVKEELHKYFHEANDQDIQITSSGVTGPDIILSEKLRRLFPFVMECKNVESLNLPAALRQAEAHAQLPNFKGLFPMVCHKKNRSELYSTLKTKDLFAFAMITQILAIEHAIESLNKKDLEKSQLQVPGACL